jgi:NADH-quinone oxidoreductase subunit J
MIPETILYVLFGLIIVSTAIAMLLSRNAVYAALFLVLNFATVALLYLMLGAPFISLWQVTVYAGSIMVLFLFVIMLLGAEHLGGEQPFGRQRAVAVGLGLVFLVELALFLLWRGGMTTVVAAPATPGFGSPAEIGKILFQQYACRSRSPDHPAGGHGGRILFTRGDVRSARKK